MFQLVKRSLPFLTTNRSLVHTPRFAFALTTFDRKTKTDDIVYENIFEILKNSPKCQKDKLSDSAKFTDIGFDSLDVVELIVAFEEKLGFDLPNEVAEQNFETVADALNAFAKNYPEKDQKAATN